MVAREMDAAVEEGAEAEILEDRVVVAGLVVEADLVEEVTEVLEETVLGTVLRESNLERDFESPDGT